MKHTSNQLSLQLRKAIEQFSFVDTQGAKFWAPYIRNDVYIQDNSVVRGLGKSSPEDIGTSVEYIKQLFPAASGEEIRTKLIDGSLPDTAMNYKGIDCSGFVFYVMSSVYEQTFSHQLTDILSVPKDAVLNGALNYEEWQQAHVITQTEIESMEPDVPMTWVVETFNRKPVNLCNVKALTSDYSSTPVDINDVQIGDLVQMSNRNDQVPHIAIITEVESNEVTLIHSGRTDPQDTGGILEEKLLKIGEGLDCLHMHSPREFAAIRRLKAS